ncbi:MAG: F0F1 ATP synthase subunit A [Candidatus Dojkabacteria bacterium]
MEPQGKFQLFIESIVLSLRDLAEGIMGKKGTHKFFPVVFTFFIVIILSNWWSLLPFTGSLGTIHTVQERAPVPIIVLGEAEHTAQNPEADTAVAAEDIEVRTDVQNNEKARQSESTVQFTRDAEIEKPFLRSPSADLNFTLAMGVLSFLIIQYAGLKALGMRYLSKFFDIRVKIPEGRKLILVPFSFLIKVFWRILELILELGRIISFAFRLFGNIFAGEVLLFVITSLTLLYTFGFATLPFLGLEIFVGFIQAIVFIFLTMVFIKLAMDTQHWNQEMICGKNK